MTGALGRVLPIAGCASLAEGVEYSRYGAAHPVRHDRRRGEHRDHEGGHAIRKCRKRKAAARDGTLGLAIRFQMI